MDLGYAEYTKVSSNVLWVLSASRYAHEEYDGLTLNEALKCFNELTTHQKINYGIARWRNARFQALDLLTKKLFGEGTLVTHVS